MRLGAGRKTLSIGGATLVVIVTGLAALSKHWSASHTSTKAQASDIVVTSTAEPSTVSPTPVPLLGPPDDPVAITLPSIDTKGPIQKVGVDSKGAMGVPNNIHTAGWFVNSVKPGQKGLSIIDGHIALTSGNGIFQKLGLLHAGQRFTVTLRNGTQQTYQIREARSVALADAPAILYSQDSGVSRQLNLITCAGDYDAEAKTFNNRVIISAVFIQ